MNIEKLYLKLSEISELYPLVRNYNLFKKKMNEASHEDIDLINKYLEAKRYASIRLALGRLGIRFTRYKFHNTLLGNELKKITTKPLLEVWNCLKDNN